MKLHPLHSVERICAYMNASGEYFPTERCTGRSTVIALQCITTAIQNPHTWVEIVDHHPTRMAHDLLTLMVKDMVDRLDLRHMTVDRRGYVCFGDTPAILPKPRKII